MSQRARWGWNDYPEEDLLDASGKVDFLKGRVGLFQSERHVLTRIAAGAPLHEVLQDLIHAIEAQSDVEMLASILLLDRDGRHLFTGAAPRLPQAYNDAIDGIEIGPHVGSCGTAAFRGEPVWVADIKTDPLWANFRDLALAHELRACWSMPIKAIDGRVLGTFAIYYREPRSPAPQDVRALGAMAQTAALAIERHLFELERTQLVDRVQRLNETLEREVEHRTRERDRIWQHSRDLLFVAGLDRVFQSANPAWKDVLGYELEDFIDATVESVLHPEDVERTLAALSRAADGAQERFESRVRHKDSSYRWISWSAVRDRDLVYASGRDVTAEKASHVELQEKSDLLEATLENMDQGLIMVDGDGVVQVCNRRAIEILDLPPEYWHSKPTFLDFINHQVAIGEFASLTEERVPWLDLKGNLLNAPPLYERTRPNGMAIEVRTVHRPDGTAVRTFMDITARKRTEAELKGSEERYRALVEASNSIVWRTAPDGSFLDDNSGWREFTGRSPETFIGDGLLQVVHPDDLDRVIAAWEAVLASGTPGENEFRVKRYDGAYRWVSTRAVALKNPDGSVREWVGTLTDIHEHRTAQEALARSEERHRLLAENATDMIIRTDLGGIRRYISPVCRDILGFEPEELIGTTLIDTIHPDDRAAVSAGLDALYEGPADQETVSYRVSHKDGHWVWLEARGRLIRNSDGRPQEVVSVVREITERVRLEEELRAAVEANRAIFEHSLDVICSIDENGAFTRVSPQAAAAWGYLPQELIGRRYLDLVHPDDHEKTVRIAERIVAGTPTTGFENRYIRRDGSVVPILWSAVWSDEHKTMFCVARDLSERLQLEEQLRQSQKMEAVGQLTGGIAHDFNNLLTVILGNAELLTENPADPALTLNLARQIVETAERGADLNSKLLAFGRRQSLKPERLKIEQAIENMVPMLHRTIGEHIELNTTLVETQLSAIVDRSLFDSAILNLVLNARDAMPQGGKLTISSGQRVGHFGEGTVPVGQQVVFVTVADTGVGMTPEVMAQVFEPFFTTKEIGKGSGLGLSMVFGFAQQSAGHVSIESKVGEGTSVTIVLPAVVGQAAKPSPHRDVPEAVTSKARVLLVEDEPQVLQFVATQLINMGYEVTAVSTGTDALDVLKQGEPFDVLFTDVVLPKGMSGVELAKQVRQTRPGMKVLLTSGYPEEVFEQHGGRDVNMPLLHKPYRRKELAESLRKVLGL